MCSWICLPLIPILTIFLISGRPSYLFMFIINQIENAPKLPMTNAKIMNGII